MYLRLHSVVKVTSSVEGFKNADGHTGSEFDLLRIHATDKNGRTIEIQLFMDDGVFPEIVDITSPDTGEINAQAPD